MKFNFKDLVESGLVTYAKDKFGLRFSIDSPSITAQVKPGPSVEDMSLADIRKKADDLVVRSFHYEGGTDSEGKAYPAGIGFRLTTNNVETEWKPFEL